jgi:hypothetical protein
MKKLIFQSVIIVSTFLSCNNETILFENKILEGTAFTENDFLGELKTISANTPIYLSLNSNGDSFISKTETDSQGKFEFNFIPKTTSPIFIFAEKKIEDVTYSASITSLESEIVLKPNYSKNYILVEVKDQNAGLNNVEVFLFSNENQAKQITNENPQNYVQKKNSNNLGKTIFYNLSISEYWVVSKHNKDISNIEKVDLKQALSKSILINIIPKTPTPQLTLKLVDKFGDFLHGVESFIFTSSLSQNNIFSKTVSGHIANGKTNNKGELVFQNLPTNQNLYIAAKEYFLKNNKIDTSYAILPFPIKLSKDTTISVLIN